MFCVYLGGAQLQITCLKGTSAFVCTHKPTCVLYCYRINLSDCLKVKQSKNWEWEREIDVRIENNILKMLCSTFKHKKCKTKKTTSTLHDCNKTKKHVIYAKRIPVVKVKTSSNQIKEGCPKEIIKLIFPNIAVWHYIEYLLY